MSTRTTTFAPSISHTPDSITATLTLEAGSNVFAGKMKYVVVGGDPENAKKNLITLTVPSVVNTARRVVILRQEGPDNASSNYDFRVTAQTATTIVIGNDTQIGSSAHTFYIAYLIMHL